MRVVALAGGVGGAKLADGLYRTIFPEDLTIIVNTGDDFEHWGLRISPDLDTVCYTLAGIANPDTGWGRTEESWRAHQAVSFLGGPDWFRIGDRDLETHLERTRRLRRGEQLSRITEEFCRAWGIRARVLPMTNQGVSTVVETTGDGDLPFQEYFVHRRCEPSVKGFRFEGLEAATSTSGVSEALVQADAVVICPSNPWVSIDPILALLSHELGAHSPLGRPRPVIVAVSPIIGGRALKGPAAKMFTELGIEPSPLAVAEHYLKIGLRGMIIDSIDANWVMPIQQLGISVLSAQTIMRDAMDRSRLAEVVLNFTSGLLRT